MAHEDKIILNSENYPGNSHSEKKEPERPKSKPVAKAKRARKSFIKRFRDSFLDGESGESIVNYIIYDVVIPAAKTTIADLVEGAIDMALFGGESSRTRRVSRVGGRSYISYNEVYRGERPGAPRHGLQRPHNVEPASRIRNDFQGVIFGSRAEAEMVLEAMQEAMDKYGVVSVGDLYDMSGLTSTNYTDNNYGWFALDGMSTRHCRDGWSLDLPRPRPIQ